MAIRSSSIGTSSGTGQRTRPNLRRPLVRTGSPSMRRLVEEARLELVPMKSLERAVGELEPRSSISMTCSPASSIEATLDESERLLAAGHRVVPHISARMTESPRHLAAIHRRLGELGIREIFVVGGDAEPHGCYFDAIEFLEAFVDLDDADGPASRRVDHIGYTAYPDTHPVISTDRLHDALHRKQQIVLGSGRSAHVTTQMCFSSDQVESWLRSERAAGLEVPVHLGIPGVIDRAKLMAMGVRLGVGTSLRYLKKNRRAIGRMMSQRSFEPDALLRPLAHQVDELGIDGLHVFTFNQVEATESWRRRTLHA